MTYAIDGNDFKLDLGFDIEKVEGLESIPGRKGVTFQDWPDENGIEPFVDSDDIILNEKIITINMYLRETTTNLAQAKLKALEDILFASGLRTFVVSYVTGSFPCYCKDSLIVERMTNAIASVITYSVILKLIQSN